MMKVNMLYKIVWFTAKFLHLLDILHLNFLWTDLCRWLLKSETLDSMYIAVVWNNYMGMKTRQYATRKHDKKGRWLFHALSCSSFVPNFLLFIFSQHENGTQKQTGSSIQRELLCWWGLLFITWVARMVQTVKSSLIKRKLWFHPFIISPFI